MLTLHIVRLKDGVDYTGDVVHEHETHGLKPFPFLRLMLVRTIEEHDIVVAFLSLRICHVSLLCWFCCPCSGYM